MVTDGRSHYEVLEVGLGATPGEIRSAYRRLAMAWHPDRPTGSAERFVRVASAYEVLSDPQRRGEYDRGVTRVSSPRPAPARSDLAHVAATIEELDALWSDFTAQHTARAWWTRRRGGR